MPTPHHPPSLDPGRRLMAAGVASPRPTPGHRALLRRPSAPTIRSWLICGVGMVVVASLLSAVVAVWERVVVVSAQDEVQQRLRPAQDATSALARAYVDQETGQRGFVWTGQSAFLDPFESGQQASRDLETRLAQLLADDPEALRRLAAVQAAGDLWQDTSALPGIGARRSGPVEGAAGLAMATEGKRLFDQLRQRLDELRQRVDQLTEQQIASMTRAQRRAAVGTALGAALAVLVAVTTVAALHRMTTRPLARLVQELSEVAGGATLQPITVGGPAELRTITAAAETMRTSLVSGAEALAAAQHQLGAFGERERMAEHVRDRTIQRLFALSLSLSHLVGTRRELVPQVAPLVEETDAIAQELRRIIFPEHLEQAPGPAAGPAPVTAARCPLGAGADPLTAG